MKVRRDVSPPAPISSVSAVSSICPGRAADPHEMVQRPELLRHPEPDVGGSGHDGGARMTDQRRRERIERSREMRSGPALRSRRRGRPRAPEAGPGSRRHSRRSDRTDPSHKPARPPARSARSRCSGQAPPGCHRSRPRTAGPDRSRTIAYIDITKPGVQKPHCEPWQSTMACCTAWRSPSGLRRSSTVSSWQPSSVATNWMQALTAR